MEPSWVDSRVGALRPALSSRPHIRRSCGAPNLGRTPSAPQCTPSSSEGHQSPLFKASLIVGATGNRSSYAGVCYSRSLLGARSMPLPSLLRAPKSGSTGSFEADFRADGESDRSPAKMPKFAEASDCDPSTSHMESPSAVGQNREGGRRTARFSQVLASSVGRERSSPTTPKDSVIYRHQDSGSPGSAMGSFCSSRHAKSSDLCSNPCEGIHASSVILRHDPGSNSRSVGIRTPRE